mgnify:CR=1 FL=1
MRPLRSALATALRFGLGGRAGGVASQPVDAPELYEFESCPYCRKVREALVWFDLDVLVRPCPPGGTRFRPGRGPFPLLVDGGQEIRGSSVIVRHLAARAGRPVPWALRLGPLVNVTSGLASAVLPRVRARASRPPERPLELFADETSPAARELRSLLCALELPYRWRTCGRGSATPLELAARTGDATLPALLDPNTGADLRGAAAAASHLSRAYAG